MEIIRPNNLPDKVLNEQLAKVESEREMLYSNNDLVICKNRMHIHLKKRNRAQVTRCLKFLIPHNNMSHLVIHVFI